MTVDTYLGYLLAVAIFFIHPPGPSQLLFMANALRFGVTRAAPTIAGDLSANAIQMCVAGFGLTGIVALSADFFIAVKWAGVAYLVWVGVRTMIARPKAADKAMAVKRGTLFRQGFVTSAANPYAVIFFAALFPQFIDPSEAVGPQVAILGVTYLVVDGTLLLALGAVAARVFAWLGGRFHRSVNRISGLLMIAAAILLSFKNMGPAAAVTPR